MFKKILAFILIGTIILIVSGCKKGEEVETDKIPSEGSYTRCIEVEERIPYNVIDTELVYYNEDKLFEESDLIFKGKVIDEKEIGLEEYIDGRLRNTYYHDVFTFKIEEIYYMEDSSVKKADVITVANTSSSHRWIEGTLKMEKDKEYIILAMEVFDTKTVDFSKYMDFAVIQYWMAIINVENENYFFDEVFTSLISGAKEEITREEGNFKTKVYEKGKEFEKELENLISKKKGKE